MCLLLENDSCIMYMLPMVNTALQSLDKGMTYE